MTALLRILILDPLAYVVACIAAGATIAIALFGVGSDPDVVGLFVGTGVGVTFYAGAFSFLPALIAIVLAEAFGWRSVFYWLAVGGGIGLAANALTGFVGAPEFADYRLVLHLAAGFVGALVYWLIAGRLSGVNRAGGTSA